MSYHVRIKWSSGATAEYSGETSKEQFLTSFFGHHDRLPEGVTIVDVPQEVVEPAIIEPATHEPAPEKQKAPAPAPVAKPAAVKVEEKKDVK